MESYRDFDYELERQLIGALLLTDRSAAREVIGIANRAWFNNPTYREIFIACETLYKEGHPVNTLTVRSELKRIDKLELVGGVAKLVELESEVVTLTNVPFAMEKLAELYKLRQLNRACQQAVEGLVQNPETITHHVGELEKAIAIETQPVKHPPRDLGHASVRYLEKTEEVNETGDIDVIKTGFPMFDDVVKLVPGEMTVIAGRPSMGKSALALQMGLQAAQQGKRVLYVSLEMSERGVMQRVFSVMTGVPGKDLSDVINLSTEQWMRLREASTKMIDIPMYLVESSSESIRSLSQLVRLLKMRYGELHMAIIDYLQLMEGVTETDNRVQEVSNISRGLKKLAMEEQMCVVALSQLSRAVEARQNKRPMLSDLRESGSIEQDCDIVAFVYRDEYYNPESLHRGEADIIIAKNRPGALDTVTLGWRPHITKFENMYSAASAAAINATRSP